MPKKSRTPPPPRRPQGPRQRTDPGKGRPGAGADERRNRLILYGVAASGIVGLAVVLGLFAFGGGGGGADTGSVKSAMAAAGCTFKTYPEQPRTPHYTSLPPKNPMKYNSFPPTSGRHYYAPLVFGPYDSPVDEYQAVHNLEHGAVIIQWGNKVPQSDVTEIQSFYRGDPNALIIAPLPKLGNKIALTAWTRLATCRRFDKNAFAKFRDAFRYHAPEKFPPDQLNPGM